MVLERAPYDNSDGQRNHRTLARLCAGSFELNNYLGMIMTEITENKEIIKYQTANAKQLAIKRLPSKINAWITGSLGPWKLSFSISSKPFSQLWSPDVLYGTLLCKEDVIFIVYKSAHLRFGFFFLPFYLPHLFFFKFMYLSTEIFMQVWSRGKQSCFCRL